MSVRHSYYARQTPRSLFSNLSTRPPSPHQHNRWSRFHKNRAVYLGSVTLAVVAPLGLSSSRGKEEASKESEDGSLEKTTEQLMLEESDLEREELRRGSKDQPLIFRVAQNIQIFMVNWLIEPFATGLRFVTLVAIFVPVILAVPLVCLGQRIPEKSGERKGTILWYAFLIKSMEQAGPTFIKVGIPSFNTYPCVRPHVHTRFVRFCQRAP